MNLLIKMKRIRDLSPSERQVVDFVLNDPELAANMGIVEIAKKTYTSTSTVMRVCKKLDMNSYIDFRIQLTADLRDYLDTEILLKYQTPIEPQDSIANIVEKVTSNNVRAVLGVKRLNDLSKFEQVVKMMSIAKQLDFFGSGVSNLICHDAMMKALRLGIPATAYSFYSEMAMLAKTSTPEHLAFIISYTGLTEDTLRVARILQKIGVPSVSITSHTDNALIEMCTVNLFVDSNETIYRIGGMSSRLSSQHVLDILFSAYMNENNDKLQTVVNKTFITDTFEHTEEKN